MNYFIKGRIYMATSEDLQALLDVEDEIKATPMISGYISRHHYGSSRPDMFTFESRTEAAADAQKLHNLFRDVMEDNGMDGWIGWHTCNHEEGGGPCTWDQIYTGGDG